jgi:parallel beta-helix repeat protein
LLAGVIATVLGCGRWGLTYNLEEQLGPDAAPIPEYDNTWTVTIQEERQEGGETITSPEDLPDGTEGLSFGEAIVIACNTPGTDEIIFDPAAFPQGSQIILTAALPPIDCDGLLIDGRDASVVISAPAPTGSLFTITGSNVTVRNLEFFDTASDVFVVGAAGTRLENLTFGAAASAAMVVEDSTGTRITNPTIRNGVANGITVIRGTDIVIDEATITDVGGNSVAVIDSNQVELNNSRIERAGSELVRFQSSSAVTVNNNFMVVQNKTTQVGLFFLEVEDSLITKNIVDPGDSHMIRLTDSTGNTIERNIIDGGEAGIVLEGLSTGNLLFANAVYQATLDGLYFSSTSTGNTAVHNTLLNCTSPIVDSSGVTTLGNNLISTDPADFVDPLPPTYDFTLAAGSLHIDAGTDLGYDCVPDEPESFLGLAPDLGAVETQ